MLVHIWCAPTWRFHTELCKFLRNISKNICGLGERTDLKLGEVSSLFIFNRITISWPYPLNGFRFIFLLRDSENDLYGWLCDWARWPNPALWLDTGAGKTALSCPLRIAHCVPQENSVPVTFNNSCTQQFARFYIILPQLSSNMTSASLVKRLRK